MTLAAFGGQPHLAASGDQLVAAWSQNDSGGGRLYAADRRPDGTWDSPKLIGDPQRDIVGARSFLLADRAGNLTVVLNTTDVRRTDPIAPPVGPGESRVDIVRRPVGGDWQPPVGLANAFRPSAAVSPSGILLTLWDDPSPGIPFALAEPGRGLTRGSTPSSSGAR